MPQPVASRFAPSGQVPARVGRVPLVGRAGVLPGLRDPAVAALDGQPTAILFSGEAGIGKTRLLAELELVLLRDVPGLRVLRGRCRDERWTSPYAPWLDAFRASVGGARPADALDRVAERMSGAGGTTAASDERQRARLFEDVARALASAAGAGPLLVELDDLQWADAASCELLGYLLPRLAASPLLVAGTVRDDELSANAVLRATLDDLNRHRLLREVPVRPLAEPESAELVGGLLGLPPPPRFAAAVHQRCGGTPFCVEEVVREWAEGSRPGRDGDGAGSAGLPLPRGVAAVIERRLRRLGADERRTLDAAALIGREPPADLLAAVTGREPAAVAADLTAAVAVGLLVRRPDPADPLAGFAFPHDGVREGVAAQVAAADRVRLHGAIADALAAQGPADDLRRLAARLHHLRLARSPEAAPAAVALAERAMRSQAHRVAARAYRMALALDPDGARTGLPRHETLLRVGAARLAAGDPAAEEAFREAEDAAGRAGALRAVAAAQRRRALLLARREDFPEATALLREALALLPPTDDAAGALERADALIDLAGIAGLSTGDYPAALAAGEEALAIGERQRARSPGTAAKARLVLANALIRSGRLRQGAALLPAALAEALAAGEADLAAEVCGAVGTHAYWTGDLDASERATLRRRDHGRAAGDPWALRHAAAWLALLHVSRGRWREAEAQLRVAERETSRLDSAEPRAFQRKVAGFSLLLRGRHAEAVALLEEAIDGFRPSGPATLAWYIGCLAAAHELAGNREAADRVVAETERLVAGLGAAAVPRAPALAELGLVAALRGDPALARDRHAALLPFAGQLHWVLTDRVLGMLAAAFGDLPRAERHFAAALATAERGGLAPESALTLAELGFARCHLGHAAEREAGAASLRAALPRLELLGMEADRGRVAAALGSPAGGRRPAGLSEREVEVLRLVAEGATNRAIAERLGISERTVATHLTHIFAKTGADNRAGAATFALRHRLA